MKFSVITVNYNNCLGLEKTIKSVVEQKEIKDFEYIIIDGASTDGSVDIIMKYSDRINFWVSEQDGGIYDAMNKGVHFAKGDYCIFMNSGDCFYDEEVLSKVSNLIRTEADFIAGDYIINKKVHKSPKTITALTLFKFIDTSICHQALFTKREILMKNPYRKEFRIVADYVNQFDSLVFGNASYTYVDVVICDVEPDGLSAVNYEELTNEKKFYLSSVMPKRIYDDYLNFWAIKLLESKYLELYSMLRKYNFSDTDVKIATSALKVAAFMKTIKLKILRKSKKNK